MALYRWNTKLAWIWKSFNPENAWTEWQVLTKTSTGYAFENVQETEYTAGDGIEIYKWPTSYSAIQWPCAEGFHIPSETEFDWLASLASDLWLSADDYSIKLHIPVSWWIDTDWTKRTSALWRLWTRTKSFTNYAGVAYIYWDSEVKKNINAQTTLGYNIRPFHNWYVSPISSWTVIQWTLGSAWIFRDTVNWLISITGDGTTWYTISDKNLWATTVYNSWDTLSEANCGKYYQRWNNYWFPFTWPTTTSTTAIDASSYWPWNYYNSSTFIKINWTWDSSYNNNLWWDITWYKNHNEISTILTMSQQNSLKNWFNDTWVELFKIDWTWNWTAGAECKVLYPVSSSIALKNYNLIKISCYVGYTNNLDSAYSEVILPVKAFKKTYNTYYHLYWLSDTTNSTSFKLLQWFDLRYGINVYDWTSFSISQATIKWCRTDLANKIYSIKVIWY